MALLEIDRLIPDYVTHLSASSDIGYFSLTEKADSPHKNAPAGFPDSAGDRLLVACLLPVIGAGSG
jgi:hypothetical protein